MDVKLNQLKQNHPITELASTLGIEILRGGLARCFNTAGHKNGDKHPSLVFQTQVNRFECKGCGVKGDALELIQQVRGLDFMGAVHFLDPNYHSGVKDKFSDRSEKVTPENYLKSRGITQETSDKFGLKLVKYFDRDAIQIPLPTGNKYRILEGDLRFAQDKDTQGCIFKTKPEAKQVILTEGEFDAILVQQNTGYPTWCGTSGAATFKEEWIKEFNGVNKIYVAYDNDEAGRLGAEKVAQLLGDDRCFQIEVPKIYGKDWTDYFNNGNSKEDFDQLLITAKSFKKDLLSRFNSKKQNQGLKIRTGFKRLDSIIGGFRTGNAYLLAGLEKSGKTAYLLTMVKNMLLDNERIGYIDTELGINELTLRMTAVYNDKETAEMENEPELIREWVEMFKDNFFYAGIDSEDEIKDNEILSFEKTLTRIDEFINKGAKVIVVDNLTSYSLVQVKGRAGWETLSSSMSRLISKAKEKNVVMIFVIHTKESVVYSETPQGISKIIQDGNANDIFKKSVVVVRKPTLADVYGGGTAHSQIAGAMLLWRPFQKFDKPDFKNISSLVLDSFRHAETSDIKMYYQGEKSTFVEDLLEVNQNE